MSRLVRRTAPASLLVAIGLLAWGSPHLRGQRGPGDWMAAHSTAKGEWPTYAGDLNGTRYSPLDQITAANFNNLKIAWRVKTDNFGNRPETKLEGTPLMVGGVLYTTAGNRRAAVALDAATGEVLWVHGEREGNRGATAPRQLSGRGLAYWSDGHGDDRILYFTPGYRMVALSAKTGQPVASFGHDGVVDLKLDMDQELALETGEGKGEIGIHATPVVAGDVVLVGASFREGMTVRTHNNPKGYVRGYDVRTGKRLWIFHTVPKKGEPGYDTWLKGSAEDNGNAGVWTQMSADTELGLAYLPIEDPTSDFYGGLRPGNNLYADSIVAVDLHTGKLKWYFQQVHHPIWDMDNSSAPILADIVVDGKPIKAIAQLSKQGFVYVLDRATGKPVWPIEEKPVPQGNVPGEWYSPTQPFPTKPPAYSRNGVTEDELIDFTPELHAKALELVKHYKIGPVFTPGVLSNIDGPLATLTLGTAGGGTNWPGGAYDPETHTIYAYACNACMTQIGLSPPPPGFSDLPYILHIAGQPFRVALAAGDRTDADAVVTPAPPPFKVPNEPSAAPRRSYTTTVDGLPLIKPPYGTLTAINLDKGDITWQIAHGETPDFIKNNPALKGLNIPRTGQSTWNVAPLVTKTLVIIGEGQETTTSTGKRGAMLRAYDKSTGKEVGAVYMDAPESGSAMTYMLDGKQYIVLATSGFGNAGEYVALSLPGPATRTNEQGR
ncbi:MAG: PQQ-binding-like beta-propeller repeat protein [Betaproteobacteria bacterium]